MNDEWFYKKSFSNLLVVIVFSILLLWGTVYFVRYRYNRQLVSQYRVESEQSRAELDKLREEQSRALTIIDAATEYCNANEEYIGQSVSTVGELRAQISLLEKSWNSVRDYIYCLHNVYIDDCDE